MPNDGAEELRQEWRKILSTVFNDTVPVSAEWSNSLEIVQVLKAISSPINHMFYPDGGGMDLIGAQLNSDGLIEWAVEEGGLESFVHAVYPLKLIFWNPGPQDHEANFVLEVGELKPVGDIRSRGEYVEEVTEVRSGKYEPLSSWENGYSQNGEPLQNARRICRTIKPARYAIFGKGSLYNQYSGRGFDAYSAYHNDPVKFAEAVQAMAKIVLS